MEQAGTPAIRAWVTKMARSGRIRWWILFVVSLLLVAMLRAYRISFLWVSLIVFLVVAIPWGYWAPHTRFGAWTGFGEFTRPKADDQEYQRSKTLWDWMGLLIVPVFLAVGGVWFAQSRESLSRELEQDRLREETLQRYLDRAAELMLLEKGLRRPTPDRAVRDIARARTLTVLRVLDGARKGILLRFLRESDLILRGERDIDLRGADLRGADLRGADLRRADLFGVDLSGADLSGADLIGIELSKAVLHKANLRGADLVMSPSADTPAKPLQATLIETDFTGADLRKTVFNAADLSRAILAKSDLRGASLFNAVLRDADLSDADLSDADLRGVDLSNADLSRASLRRADFTGANLLQTKHLTQSQLDSAKGDARNTKLPKGLVLPKSWSNPVTR
jgi:uncharacterized protein YjbI with pentapeptide repeats